MAKSFDITALGYCSTDHLCLLPEIPIDDKVEITEMISHGGGPAATAAFAAARLGARTAFVSVVGDDQNGAKIIRELEQTGIDVSGMVTRKSAVSPVAFCWADAKTGKRSIAWTRGTAAPLRPKEVRTDIVAASKILHLDGHQTEAALHAAKFAKNNGVRVMLDAGSFRPHMTELLALCDTAITSEVFARDFSGGDDVRAALRKIFETGVRIAVATLGDKGAVGYDGKKFVEQKAFPVKVVDTTGAGDVYHGAFARKSLTCDDLAETMLFASAVAAMKCRSLGGRNGIPTLGEAEDFIRQERK